MLVLWIYCLLYLAFVYSLHWVNDLPKALSEVSVFWFNLLHIHIQHHLAVSN